ncbi:hypothetical protein PHET_09376 [Paragonimus heterotremus]|uniref:Complex I-B17 n=1 Tax=Paragonimus heterotremus TaxID=100268 RepID=A0A8J4SZQ5_9TREM|nr:hypothetical protein PHET_09376 [Paragonimus heterotremus]
MAVIDSILFESILDYSRCYFVCARDLFESLNLSSDWRKSNVGVTLNFSCRKPIGQLIPPWPSGPTLSTMSGVTAGSVPSIDPEVLELQKKLYKEQLIRQATLKRGSKFYPINIEPFALERDRLALPFTDQDRAMRKQWLKDQALSDREPVDIPEWTRVNIFRRVYRKPFDAITNLVRPILVRLILLSNLSLQGPEYSRYFRWNLPKVVVGLSITWLLWYRVKYTPSTWEDGRRGFRVQRAYKPSIYPGQPDFPDSPLLTREFGMEDFEKRTVFRGEKLVTSGP